MDKLETLEHCKQTYLTKGCKLIELTHEDGTKSGIANPEAIKVVINALLAELDRQIEKEVRHA